jgi:transcriptional regulator with XRE-family HTH domain
MGHFLMHNHAMSKHDNLKEILATNLTALMRDHATLNSVAEVAERSGVGRGTVDRVKKAEVSTSIDVIEKLADAFGVTPTALLSQALGRQSAEARETATKVEPDEIIRMIIMYGQSTNPAKIRIMRYMESEDKIAGSGRLTAAAD